MESKRAQNNDLELKASAPVPQASWHPHGIGALAVRSNSKVGAHETGKRESLAMMSCLVCTNIPCIFYISLHPSTICALTSRDLNFLPESACARVDNIASLTEDDRHAPWMRFFPYMLLPFDFYFILIQQILPQAEKRTKSTNKRRNMIWAIIPL